MITYKELNIKVKELEKKTGVQHLDIYRRFMFERILERISVSNYCELFNLDGSPSCRSYASRKTYEGKIIDNVAELTYKREYQRRITRVYRSDETEKTMRQKEFALWKTKARKQLSIYRQGKITQQDFCEWIEKNK